MKRNFFAFLILSITISTNASWDNPPSGTLKVGCEHHTFYSTANKTNIGFNIFLPPGYNSTTERYPVIYSLHGMGNTECYDFYHFFPDTLQKYIKAGTLPPMIVVFANGNDNCFYSDSKDSLYKIETSIIKELIPDVDSTYRTIADQGHRALEGISMGGFGASLLAFKYPHMFCSVTVYAGALLEWNALSTQIFATKMWSGDSVYYNNNCNPFSFAVSNAAAIASNQKVRIVVGSADTIIAPMLPQNQKMYNLLYAEKIPVTITIVDRVAHDANALFKAQGLNTYLFHSNNFLNHTNVKKNNLEYSITPVLESNVCIVPWNSVRIPAQWHSISDEIALYSVVGTRIGRENIRGRETLDGAEMSKQYGCKNIIIKPILR